MYSLKHFTTHKFITDELVISVKVHLLPYHKLGETKNETLEKPNNSISMEPTTEEHMAKLQKIVVSFGLSAVIGG